MKSLIIWHRKSNFNVQILWILTPLCHFIVTDIKKTFVNVIFFCKIIACVKCVNAISLIWLDSGHLEVYYCHSTETTFSFSNYQDIRSKITVASSSPWLIADLVNRETLSANYKKQHILLDRKTNIFWYISLIMAFVTSTQ